MSVYYNELESYPAEWMVNLGGAGQIPVGTVSTADIREVKVEEVKKYEQVHFFAGIGGWAYALRLAGWDNRPVWTGSCPCQPFSSAGKRKGATDERHLWPVWKKLIAQCHPPVIFGEQVTSPLGREWLAGVQADLEALGYRFAAADLCAAGVGAPHIRQRLWWVADTQCDACQLGRITDKSREGVRTARTGTYAESGRCSRTGGMADSTEQRGNKSPRVIKAREDRQANTEPNASGECAERLSRCGRTGGVADSDGCGRDGGSPNAGRCQEQRAAASGGGEGGRHWSRAILIPCADGKTRRIEPGIEPLVDGLSPGMGCDCPGEDSPFRVIRDPETGRSLGQAPWRIGMLRAYGNAVVPQVAATFIRAYMSVRKKRTAL